MAADVICREGDGAVRGVDVLRRAPGRAAMGTSMEPSRKR